MRRLPELGRLAMLMLLAPFLLTCNGTSSIWSAKLSDLENRRQIFEERTGRVQDGNLGGASRRAGDDSFNGVVQVGSGQFVSSGSGFSLDSRDDGGNGVTLNLVDVSVPKAISVVLGEILGLNYLIDDR
ncbi:MAG TPA: hypothetical protein VHG92_14005, partial [Afifellaceae bacterium]|nr:hypothetical protein [Afifellaceae bacterium]